MQVPGNLVQKRLGGSRWPGGLTIATGAVAASTAAVMSFSGFYTLRIALGMVEAGFAPGAILFFTRW